MEAKPDLVIRPGRVMWVLTTIAVTIVAFSTAGQFFKHVLGHDTVLGFVPEFYVGYESNIPTFFSTALWLLAAAMSGVVAAAERTCGGRDAGHWSGLTVGLLYLALDEAGSLHERLIDRLHHRVWLGPTLIVVVALVALYAGFVRRLPPKVRRLAILGGITFCAGAFAIEMVGVLFFHRRAGDGLAEAMYSTLLESLEMAGALLLTSSLLVHLAIRYPTVGLRFVAAPPS